jgi:hypothetical protein
MPQVVNGHLLGSPGGVGARPIYILYGSGVPDGQDPNIGLAQLGSLYLDYTNGALYLKTALPSTWTLK